MNSWPKQLIGQQASGAIQNANAGLNASAQKMYNQQMQDLQQAQQQASQQTGLVNGQVMPISTIPPRSPSVDAWSWAAAQAHAWAEG
jgi:hypothetical protein